MPPATESLEIEREYVAHRGAVMAMLRSDFGGLPDLEELYQDAWTELLELRSRGEKPKSVRGLLKTIAWRRARDRLRKMKPETLDPTSPVLTLEADTEPLPDEQAQVHLDAVVLRLIIDRLEPRQAAALKLRFDWHLDSREIQERLGVSAKRLEKIVTEAYKNVAAEIGETHGESRWSRRQRSLLLACEMGLASKRQRERAQQMVDEDPACRAMLREMRTRLTDVAVAAPTPVLFESRLPDPIPILDRLGDAWASAKHTAASLIGRSPGNASSIEQATGAGGALIGGGVATKAVVACLAAGGGAVLCVESGFLQKSPAPQTETTRRAAPRATPPKPERTAAVRERPVTAKTAMTKPKAKKSTTPKRTSLAPTSSPKAKPEPSPAPAGSTEFGPGTVGSSAPAATPAAAPTDGGGEFGP
jgi:RNA polymerase sigma factor (sigma-70 family)